MLDANTLAQLIVTKLQAKQSGDGRDLITMEEFAAAIAEAVVEHIQQNAQVVVAGVTPGGGTATGTVR